MQPIDASTRKMVNTVYDRQRGKRTEASPNEVLGVGRAVEASVKEGVEVDRHTGQAARA